MGQFRNSAALAAVALLLAAGSAAATPVNLPLDQETHVAGVEVACTGFGLDARADPRWQSYGTRIEFSNARSEYLAGGAVTIRDRAGRVVLDVVCDAPWLLVRLASGAYRVDARLAGDDAQSQGAGFTATGKGQQRIVLKFADNP